MGGIECGIEIRTKSMFGIGIRNRAEVGAGNAAFRESNWARCTLIATAELIKTVLFTSAASFGCAGALNLKGSKGGANLVRGSPLQLLLPDITLNEQMQLKLHKLAARICIASGSLRRCTTPVEVGREPGVSLALRSATTSAITDLRFQANVFI
ncbi:hypothetical protein EVAR_24373_1 [Eumeta japonica]|uniref:Uncharacterized protein n=1 Tax=Eumeta variegata TaxID=151549 RepID=A0A4C1YCA4_EUMVA|nr:hypothetical protein EVAR_24373_1 [Eumeta japonica]